MKAKHPERADRLREFFNRLSIKNKTLASKLGIKPAFISQLLNKHSTITTDVAFRIGRAYPNLNVMWLLEGEGEMFLAEGEINKQLKSGVEEPGRPVYGKIALDDLPAMLERMEREMQELREEVKRLKEGKKG